MTNMLGYRKILVAMDFSAHSEAALRQAVWVARQSGARVVLAHCRPDLRKVVHSASTKAKLDLLLGEGDQFEREVRQKTDHRMRQLIAGIHATDLDIRCETLLGEPFVELIHAVQQEGYDLVLAGRRGLAAWQEFFVGSTTQRLVRKCPASVWVCKAEHIGCPKSVLAATDFSDVSRRAVLEGLSVARQASAPFHLLHVIDSRDVPEDAISTVSEASSLREEVNQAARHRLDAFVTSLETAPSSIHTHLSWGTPWQEIRRIATQQKIDLIAMGTVGRSGIKGVLLGSTAEKVLTICDCSLLTVKPEGYESPISPPFWPLHPA